MDSDDYLAPEALSVVIRQIRQTHGDIYSFQCYCTDGCGGDTPLTMSACFAEPFTLAQHPEFLLSLPTTWARVWRRAFLLDSGVRFPSRVWYEDIRTSTKWFALARSIHTLPDHLYYYRNMRQGSIMNSGKLERNREIMEAFDTSTKWFALARSIHTLPDHLYYYRNMRQGSIMNSGKLERNREIMEAFDDILDWFTQKGLAEQYHNELCRLAIDHMMLAASVRVAKIDPDSPILGELLGYMHSRFPDSEQYHNELCRLAIDHMMLAASVRVAKIDPDSPILGELLGYMHSRFPDYRHNPYRRELPAPRKLVFWLVDHRQFRILGSPILGELLGYMHSRFPDYRHNPYRRELPAPRKLVFWLVDHRQFRILGRLFRNR